jgi:hypothetical protein
VAALIVGQYALIMRITTSRGRLLFLMSLVAFACLMFWWLSPQDPHKPRTVIGARLMRFRDFEFGHNGFYDKDEDTGRTTLTGDAYRCGLIVIFVSRRCED